MHGRVCRGMRRGMRRCAEVCRGVHGGVWRCTEGCVEVHGGVHGGAWSVQIYYPFFTPTADTESWAAEAFLLCVFTSTKSPRGPPWNEGHRPKVLQETSVFEVPAQEQHEHSFYSGSTNTFITCSLYTVRRYRTSPGAPDLRARLG